MAIHPLIPDAGARVGPGLLVTARFDGLAIMDGDYGEANVAVLNEDGTTHHTLDFGTSLPWQIALDNSFAVVTVRLGTIPDRTAAQHQGIADGAAVAIGWRWFRADVTSIDSLTTAASYVFDPYSGLPLLLPSADLLQRILDSVTRTY